MRNPFLAGNAPVNGTPFSHGEKPEEVPKEEIFTHVPSVDPVTAPVQVPVSEDANTPPPPQVPDPPSVHQYLRRVL